MTWQQNIFQVLIITSSAGTPTGLFEYSGAPVLGNPPIAYATAPGVTKDPVGNTLPVTSGGFVSSSSASGQFGVLQNAAFLLGSANASTHIIADGVVALLDALAVNVAPGIAITAPSTPTGGGAQINVLGESQDASKPAQVVIGAPIAAPTTTALLEVQGGVQTTNLNSIIANGNLQSQLGDALISAGNVNITTAGKGVLRTGETWHVVGAGGQPPFLNSFTAGGTAPRFQVEAVGGGRVRLSGAVNTGAVTAANTAIFTLPAGYRPSRTLAFVTSNNITAYTLGQASVQVITTGDVQLVPAGTAGKFVLLDGICFELD